MCIYICIYIYDMLNILIIVIMQRLQWVAMWKHRETATPTTYMRFVGLSPLTLFQSVDNLSLIESR